MYVLVYSFQKVQELFKINFQCFLNYFQIKHFFI